MADKTKKPFSRKKIQETEGSGFGDYSENTGGGKPFERGKSTTRTTKEQGNIRRQQNDTMQPRTSDGKFTYNSVNGKGIKYEARGKTVNPLLTGGENGIMIKDVEKQFSDKSGDYWDKYKNDWYREGDEQIVGLGKGKLKTKIAAQDIWEIARNTYDWIKGDFSLEKGDLMYKPKKVGKPIIREHVSDKNFSQSKSGRIGKEEKAAMAEAKKTGEAQNVLSQAGGIKNKPNYVRKNPTFTQMQAQKAASSMARAIMSPRKSPISPSAPTQGTSAQPGQPLVQGQGSSNAAGTQMAHTSEQIQNARDFLKKYYDDAEAVDGFTDEQIDNIYDQFKDAIEAEVEAELPIEQADDSAQPAPEQSEVEPSEPKGQDGEDSDSIKKIKQMGFNDK